MADQEYNYRAFWDEMIKLIRHEIADQEYFMWFNRIEYLRSDADTIVASVPSNYIRDQIKERYKTLIESKLNELYGDTLHIQFEIIKGSSKSTSAPPETRHETETRAAEREEPAGQKIHTLNPRSEPSRSSDIRIDTPPHPLLHPQYTFKNFVEGENNQFAYNTALAIARNPGKAYNPCLIYGGVGLGKTHLLQSVGNHIHQEFPNQKIVYISMENFINDFVSSINKNAMQSFKTKYRTTDVLIIDDIHTIQNKTETQEELFYTFEALFHNSKQMVFSCDRPISELRDISERIASRFQRGVIVDLQPPSYETRYAILRKKLEVWGIDIPDEALNVISTNITTNVRDLEAALTKLRAYSELVSKDITLDITNQILKDFFSVSATKNITIELILKAVAQYFGLTSSEMKGKKKTRALSYPRQIAMYIAREITDYSTTEIGLEFGGRDHTTVMHACQQVSNRMKTDSTLEPLITSLIRTIKSDGVKG